MKPAMRRRTFEALSLGAAGALVANRAWGRKAVPDMRPAISRVAILNQNTYDSGLAAKLLTGLRLFNLDIRNKTVLLKPNLVEYIPGAAVNTDARLVGAAAEAFRELGARLVRVAEGPGHQRDTQLVLAETGMDRQLGERGIGFVDLNRDDVVKVPLRTAFSALGSVWLPRTVMDSDFIVSMPKVKTHHWAGVTLSLKNMFGIVPGIAYGWPKNVLHWHGIDASILDLSSTVRPHFVIADGIVAMEGNGPLHGPARQFGHIVLSDDTVAADFTCARLMGLNPWRVRHLAHAAGFLGNGGERISQIGEALPHAPLPFAVLPEFLQLHIEESRSARASAAVFGGTRQRP